MIIVKIRMDRLNRYEVCLLSSSQTSGSDRTLRTFETEGAAFQFADGYHAALTDQFDHSDVVIDHGDTGFLTKENILFDDSEMS